MNSSAIAIVLSVNLWVIEYCETHMIIKLWHRCKIISIDPHSEDNRDARLHSQWLWWPLLLDFAHTFHQVESTLASSYKKQNLKWFSDSVNPKFLLIKFCLVPCRSAGVQLLAYFRWTLVWETQLTHTLMMEAEFENGMLLLQLTAKLGYLVTSLAHVLTWIGVLWNFSGTVFIVSSDELL